jgi:hypothetical protein
MPIVITITNEPITVDGSGNIYDYSGYDRILRNILKNEYETFYSGQNQGKLDQQLIDSINNQETFKIYYRPKTSISYTYLGETNIVDIIQYRQVPIGIDASQDEKLQLHMVVRNIYNTIVPTNNFEGSGKFKKDVLVHSGLRNTNGDIIIQHNKNTNIGFYYYAAF